MAKLYVGYLYQIQEGNGLVHSYTDKSCSQAAPVKVPGNYMLYKKIPFVKGYVREAITGKIIKVIANDTRAPLGVHTFFKYEGRIYQRKQVATREQIENYMAYHKDSSKYKEQIEAIFKLGDKKKKSRFKIKKSRKKEDREFMRQAFKDFKTGEYEKKAASMYGPSEEFERKMDIQRSIDAEYSGSAGPNFGRGRDYNGPVVDMMHDYEMNAGSRRGNLDERDKIEIDGLFEGKEAKKEEINSKKEETVKKTEEKSTTSNNNGENFSSQVVDNSKKETVEKKDDVEFKASSVTSQANNEVDELGVVVKKSNQFDNPSKAEVPKKEDSYSSVGKVEVTVSSTGKPEETVIKELAKESEKGNIGIATLRGVNLSTRFLKTERDLTEYYLYKNYGKEPTSQSVLSVIELEKSMDLLGDNSKSNTRSM